MATRLEDVPRDLIVDFDIFDDSIVETVFAHQEALQKTKPLAYSPSHGGYWMVSSYEDVYEVISNDDIFSTAETALMAGNAARLPPLHFDPPEHAEYRAILNPLFTPKRIEIIQAAIRRKATELVDAFAHRGSCDFIAEFAHPLPTNTFLWIMGWPPEDLPLLTSWAEYLIVVGSRETEGLMAERVATQQKVRAYFRKMIEQRRADPDADDATGHMLRARYAGERPLTDDELTRMLSLLMVAGLHTVRGIMSYGMVFLSENPEQRQRLIDDPSLIPSAVEELLRLGVGTSPARLVTKPVTIRGVELQPGDHVVSLLSAANRDPSVFASPHMLEVGRKQNRHLSFAVGRHRCIGSTLARIELTLAFEELLRRIPDFRIDPDRPPQYHHGPIRGVLDLHLKFTPERR
jgi:cytochrome P450